MEIKVFLLIARCCWLIDWWELFLVMVAQRLLCLHSVACFINASNRKEYVWERQAIEEGTHFLMKKTQHISIYFFMYYVNLPNNSMPWLRFIYEFW